MKNIFKLSFLFTLFCMTLVTSNPMLFADDGLMSAAEPEEEEEQFDISLTADQIAAAEVKKTGVYWKAPDFSKQDTALGWTPEIFNSPPGFQRRVNFWIDIYTKYNIHQALLHDARYMDIVYKIIDFKEIESKNELTLGEKERLKKRLIKDEKRMIREQLARIQKLEDSPSQMSPEDYAVFQKFRFINEKNKFTEAAHRTRLRMQLGQRDRFLLGIYFSGRYIREMEKIFREEGMPIELTRLPFVESSFNLYAYSRVGASGIWQFMRSTGRLFSLKIDPIKDPRNDPIAATRAAARLLKANYKMLGSWPLALTGYNHGPQGVAQAAKKQKSTDINEIVWNTTRRRFGFASENFYAEFLAALHVESHAAKYFGNVEVSPAVEYVEIELPQAMAFQDLGLMLKVSKDKDEGFERARVYNPFFTRTVLSGSRLIPQGTVVRIPKKSKERFLTKLKDLSPRKVVLSLKSGFYKVLPGDTLSGISRDFGVSVRKLLEANNMLPTQVLRPGQKIVIPGAEGT